MDSSTWYLKLKKPSWAPPASLFGPVWSVLYIMIFLSFGTVFYQAATGMVPWVIAIPFGLNLVFNFSFTYFQFGLKNNLLASADIVLVLVTLIWAMVIIWPHLSWVTLINIPYFLWVLFATVLQLTITRLNN
jgi:tryptophan-rich sensory protein